MTGAWGKSRWTNELLDSMRLVGDDVADQPVRAVLDSGGVEQVNALMATLVRVDQPIPDELPEELKHYLNTTLELPGWADPQRIRRGQEVFETWGAQICLCLFCASLPASYAAAKGVQVLDRTAQLELATNRKRRITETGLFLIDACYVGGLDVNGPGLRTIQKVRLMHAAVRQLIRGRAAERPEVWDYATLGQPINQEDLVGTRLVFAGAVIDSLPRIGIRLDDRDYEDYLHLWNVIGHLLGVDDRLLVTDVDDAIALADLVRLRHYSASDAGKRMTAALLELLYEITPGDHVDRRIYPALIRHFITDGIADLLEVPRSSLVDDVGRLVRILEWFLTRVLGRPDRLARLARPASREMLKGMLLWQRGSRPPFAIPDRLAEKWNL